MPAAATPILYVYGSPQYQGGAGFQRRRRISTTAPDFNGGAGFQQRRRISTAALDFDSDAEPHPDDDAGHRRRGCVDRRIDAVLRRKPRDCGLACPYPACVLRASSVRTSVIGKNRNSAKRKLKMDFARLFLPGFQLRFSSSMSATSRWHGKKNNYFLFRSFFLGVK